MISIDNYNKTFPKWPPLNKEGRWIYGIWVIGNNYRNKTQYYGAYPPTYLRRIKALFPECHNVLHLFAGKCETGLWDIEETIDINPNVNPTYVANVEDISGIGKYDLILADPPYSKEDALRYGYSMINRKKCLNNATNFLNDNGYIVWLDTVFPMFNKEKLSIIGTIGIIRSTNHRIRCAFIWKKA